MVLHCKQSLKNRENNEKLSSAYASLHNAYLIVDVTKPQCLITFRICTYLS